jgi:hypothetical protein
MTVYKAYMAAKNAFMALSIVTSANSFSINADFLVIWKTYYLSKMHELINNSLTFALSYIHV